MGGSGFSSKRKSSKKKSSKISSEARLKKRSRRNKSKKLRRHNDSAGSYSDDDSTSLMSVSSSGSEVDYKNRRARSRKRSDVKSSKKKGRRRSPSQSSGEDSPRVKKRKRSKKNVNSELRKKTQKKKRKKDASIRSTSSDSRSCSTCHGGSGSEESEFERSRGRSRDKNKDKRDLGKARSGTKKSKNRSPSRSSCSRHSENSGDYSEKLAIVNNSRRLRSVITVTKQTEEKEENDWDKDEHKEEIVCDHDEYPSCRSNDSNDGGSKKELAHHSHVASQKRRQVENVKREAASVSKTLELVESGKNGGSQYDGNNPRNDGVAIADSRKENESTVPATIDDLESILRQKALENLRKFRGGVQTNAKTRTDQENEGDNDVRQFFTAKAQFGRIKSLSQDSRPTLRIDSSRSTRIEGKISDEKYSGTESETAKQRVVCSPDRTVMGRDPKEKDPITTSTVANKFESSRSELRHGSSGTYSTSKQATLQASSKANMLAGESSVNKSTADEASQFVAQSSGDNHGTGVINASNSDIPESSSRTESTPAEHGSKERQDDAKDGSKLEEKTMSVMRGGEMVQVSYKVYIPKKTPALARRQLKR